MYAYDVILSLQFKCTYIYCKLIELQFILQQLKIVFSGVLEIKPKRNEYVWVVMAMAS